jgi:hypothetical protein
MQPKDIHNLIDKCLRSGVQSLRWRDQYGAVVEVKFRDGQVETATVTTPTAAEPTVIDFYPGKGGPVGPADPDPDLCACGHLLGAEHNDMGCLHGCNEGLCQSNPPMVPEDKP